MGLSFSRLRWLLLALALAGGALLALLAGGGSGHAASVPLSIAVQGNHFVNGAGQTVRLLGVDHPSMEYACVDGYAYDDGHFDAADAAAIASWKANTVRVPLNEDCWLGINGQPNSSQGADPPLTMAGYRQAVQDYVGAATAAGLYVILDLHWSAPTIHVADGQRAMPDDHSSPFWTSVASTFASNPAVVFDAFNEPYSPAMVNAPSKPVDWTCWKSGGCIVPDVSDQVQNADNAPSFVAVGMQAMVDAIRAGGAKQPILLGGLGYSNDLTGWLAHEPSDPLGQLAASFHVYQGLPCDNQACWDSQVAPVSKQVPVVTGEFDQDLGAASTFDVDYMNWADANGIGYLAWGWWVLSAQEIADAGDGAYYLLTDYSGAPAAPNGTNLHSHLLALAAAPTTTTTPTTPTTTAPPTAPVLAKAKLGSLAAKVTKGGTSISFAVKANQKSTLVITVRTVAKYLVAGKKKQLSVGSLRATLLAGKTKSVTLHLSSATHALLVRLHSLRVQVTTSLTGTSRTASVSSRLVTLKTPGKTKTS
jgi:hypothetical protein